MADEENRPAASGAAEGETPTSQPASSAKLAAVEDAILAAARAAANAGEPKPEEKKPAEAKPPEKVDKVQEWALAIFLMMAMALVLWMILRFLRP